MNYELTLFTFSIISQYLIAASLVGGLVCRFTRNHNRTLGLVWFSLVWPVTVPCSIVGITMIWAFELASGKKVR